MHVPTDYTNRLKTELINSIPYAVINPDIE